MFVELSLSNQGSYRFIRKHMNNEGLHCKGLWQHHKSRNTNIRIVCLLMMVNKMCVSYGSSCSYFLFVTLLFKGAST
jgi:hypothetical protein